MKKKRGLKITLGLLLCGVLVYGVLYLSGLTDMKTVEPEIYGQTQYTDGNYGYIVENGQAYITTIRRIGMVLEIPETVGGYKVAYIDDEAVSYEREYRIVKFSLPDTVTHFWNSNIDLSLWYRMQPDGAVYAGNILIGFKGEAESIEPFAVREGTTAITVFAFYRSDVREVVLPDSVQYIGEGAFRDCESLEIINIPEHTELHDWAFMGCSSLERENIICSEEKRETIVLFGE